MALAGFMGAGKSTLGAALAERLGRPFVDTDEIVVREAKRPIPDLFADGVFRAHEEECVLRALARAAPSVIALGGGAVESEVVRDALGASALTIVLDVDADTAWERSQGSDRPLARNEADFRRLFERRAPLYEQVADRRVGSLEDAVLAAGGVHVETGALQRLGELVPGDGTIEIVSDARVAGIYGMELQLALGARVRAAHELSPGEEAKTVESLEALWHAIRLERRGTIVALGGGCTTDAAGFAAATYLRGIDWVAVPTTLVGQVDAAIGGKTAIDLPGGKNLVGAFHWPVRTVIDPAMLATLPEEELANGRSEVVKTGLLAGEALWKLPLAEQIRRCATFKTALCLRDPRDRGERAQLNLGHTFAHALEAAAGFELSHGRAVALGLVAALRLSGIDATEVVEALHPEPVRVNRDDAWAALSRDKKVVGGVPRLVLLDAPGQPRIGVQLPEADVRAALDSLIAG